MTKLTLFNAVYCNAAKNKNKVRCRKKDTVSLSEISLKYDLFTAIMS